MYIVHKLTIIVCGVVTLLLIAIGLFQSFDVNIQGEIIVSLAILILPIIDLSEIKRSHRPEVLFTKQTIPYWIILIAGVVILFSYSYLMGLGIAVIGWAVLFILVTQKFYYLQTSKNLN